LQKSQDWSVYLGSGFEIKITAGFFAIILFVFRVVPAIIVGEIGGRSCFYIASVLINKSIKGVYREISLIKTANFEVKLNNQKKAVNTGVKKRP
jgi:hypothetical protein